MDARWRRRVLWGGCRWWRVYAVGCRGQIRRLGLLPRVGQRGCRLPRTVVVVGGVSDACDPPARRGKRLPDGSRGERWPSANNRAASRALVWATAAGEGGARGGAVVTVPLANPPRPTCCPRSRCCCRHAPAAARLYRRPAADRRRGKSRGDTRAEPLRLRPRLSSRAPSPRTLRRPRSILEHVAAVALCDLVAPPHPSPPAPRPTLPLRLVPPPPPPPLPPP